MIEHMRLSAWCTRIEDEDVIINVFITAKIFKVTSVWLIPSGATFELLVIVWLQNHQHKHATTATGLCGVRSLLEHQQQHRKFRDHMKSTINYNQYGLLLK
jgi:hypothetical protein